MGGGAFKEGSTLQRHKLLLRENLGHQGPTRRTKAFSNIGMALAFCISLSLASSASAQETISGEWVVEQGHSAGNVVLTLHRDTGENTFMSSSTVSLETFKGLSQGQMSSPGNNVNFQIVREAGLVSCEGYFKEGKGSGVFTFTPSQDFVAKLSARGYTDISDEMQFRMALHDVTVGFIQEFADLGYDHIPAGELVSMRVHNVTADFVKSLKALGYDQVPIRDLRAMRIHGVTADFIKSLAEAGYQNPPVNQLVSLRIHDVSIDFIKAMQSAGLAPLKIDQLVKMRIHDVNPAFVKEVRSLGYEQASAEQLVKLRIFNVSPEYIQRVKDRVTGDVTIEQLIRLKTVESR